MKALSVNKCGHNMMFTAIFCFLYRQQTIHNQGDYCDNDICAVRVSEPVCEDRGGGILVNVQVVETSLHAEPWLHQTIRYS